MVDTKSCLLLLILVTLVASVEEKSNQQLSPAKRNFALKQKYYHQLQLGVRNEQYDAKELQVYRRTLFKTTLKREEHLELRATSASKDNNTGVVITLKNRALMTTRLRALYTDSKCEPYLAESDTAWAFQTKSVTLPVDAEHIKVFIDKDMLFGVWRTVYNGTLAASGKCISVSGTTFFSSSTKCE